MNRARHEEQGAPHQRDQHGLSEIGLRTRTPTVPSSSISEGGSGTSDFARIRQTARRPDDEGRRELQAGC
jgi:hypothetical protein